MQDGGSQERAAPKPRRKIRESEKKIVAARQAWRCSGCDALLSSAFQVDHTVPLWKGGADDISNATATCACCHARKTQIEAIERADIAMQERARRAEEAQREAERTIRAKEEAAREERVLPGGRRQCALCDEVYYTIFKHACAAVEERVNARLGRRPSAPPEQPNPFLRFTFTAGV